LERIKNLGLELADISLYHGHRGLDYLLTLPIVQKTDAIVDFRGKKELLESGYRTMNDKVIIPLFQHVLVLYDTANNYVTLLIEGVNKITDEALEYVKKNYSTIKVFITDKWTRFDMEVKAGLNIEELKKNTVSLYNFLKDYKYIEKANCIKEDLFQQARDFIKSQSPKQSKKQIASDEDDDDEGEDEADSNKENSKISDKEVKKPVGEVKKPVGEVKKPVEEVKKPVEEVKKTESKKTDEKLD
jgi:hypothetical protein